MKFFICLSCHRKYPLFDERRIIKYCKSCLEEMEVIEIKEGVNDGRFEINKV